MDNIQVRFAPSPTGDLHVGGARTAIFNWLFARHYGGKFFLRIEDTDIKRSSNEKVEQIVDALKWLGIDWDGEIYYQSEHLEEYKKVAEELLNKGFAYRCFCEEKEEVSSTPEEEEEGVEEILYKYDRKCLALTEEEIQQNLKEGKPYVIRFKIPEGETSFFDVIHGQIEVKNEELEDFVLLRSNGLPTYNLAVVVDDHKMEITHVIRGDDHIPNTPKQILLYRAMGWKTPHFAHVPLVLGTDRKRLSKRHGAASVQEYRDMGVLADALFNYLVQLGWSPKQKKEFFSRTELVELFTLGGINKKAAVFDPKKLMWMNGKMISSRPAIDLFNPVLDVLEKHFDIMAYSEEFFIGFIDLLKDRVKTLNDFVEVGRYFFEDPQEYEKKGLTQYFEDSRIFGWLGVLQEKLAALSEFSAQKIEKVVREYASSVGVPAATFIHPLRLIVTGRTVSPSLFEMLELVGQERVVRRIEQFLNKKEELFPVRE